MSHANIIRAWKDKEYRLNLSDAEIAQLPNHASGLFELTDADLDSVVGGRPPEGGGTKPVTRCC